MNNNEITERNLILWKEIALGNKKAVSDFIASNQNLLHKICANTKWNRYHLAEYDDVFATATINLLFFINERVANNVNMSTSYDMYKLYLDVLSKTKENLAEQYSNGGMHIPYATKKLYF